MIVPKRIVRLAVFVTATVAIAAAQPPQARIKIDTDRAVGEVDPHLFGNFTEHLGRCIYGGIYDEGNPLSDSDGFRQDVMQAVRDLNVSLLRWPGGNFVSGYHWEDGIGPRDTRPVRRDDAWGALETNRFGTNEFLKYCERVSAEPYLCINAVEGMRPGLAFYEVPDHRLCLLGDGSYANEMARAALGQTCGAPMGMRSPGTSRYGGLEMRSMARGNWATVPPKTMRSSAWRPPRRCAGRMRASI